MIALRLQPLPTLRQIRPFVALVGALAIVGAAVWFLDGGGVADDGAADAAVRLTGGSGSGVTPRIGEPAPEFTLEDLTGGSLALTELRGRPVIVNFWASWCPPCRGEMPDLEEVARQHRAAGLTIVAINLDEERGAVQRYATALDLSVAIGLDRGGRVSALYNLVALPTSFFVDREGVVRDLNIGALTARGLQAKVARVLD